MIVSAIQLISQAATDAATTAAEKAQAAAEAATKAAAAATAAAEKAQQVVTPPTGGAGPTVAMILVAAIAIITLLSLMVIYKNLKADAKWSIADALSEDVALATTKVDPATSLPLRDAAGDVAKETELKASSSRLIALLGSVAILMLYVGAGLAVLYQFVQSGGVPSGTKDMTGYFVYGLVLFTPYAVNKGSELLGWLK
jgi:type IV secretory pathway VirB2 component (pilin)